MVPAAPRGEPGLLGQALVGAAAVHRLLANSIVNFAPQVMNFRARPRGARAGSAAGAGPLSAWL